jgi:hypothetical protein
MGHTQGRTWAQARVLRRFRLLYVFGAKPGVVNGRQFSRTAPKNTIEEEDSACSN